MRFLFIILFLFTGNAFSAVFYWNCGQVQCTPQPSLKQAALNSATSQGVSTAIIANWQFDRCEFIHASYGYCKWREPHPDNPNIFNTYSYYAQRLGDSCSAGTTYNLVTGACDQPLVGDGEWCSAPGQTTTKTFIMSNGVCVAPTDAALKDQCKAYSKSPDSGASVVITWKYPAADSEELRNPQKAANAMGCEIQLLQDISCETRPPEIVKDVFNPDGSFVTLPKTFKCKTNSVLTGNVAPDPKGTPAGSLCEGDECTIEPPAELKEEKPCTYVYDAEGRKTCSSWAFTGKEGAEQCGTVGGVFSCKNDLPKATGKGLSIGTVIDEKPNPDGSKTTTKTDTAKQIVCLANACTTTTTINKTTSIHGADGSLQSTTGTCTGALCASGGKGDADGDGLGDCKGTDCGEEEGGSSAPPAMPELEKEDTYGETTSKFITRIKSAPLVAGISAIALPQGGSCSIGSAQTWFGSIDFSVFCQLAPQILASLRYLFIAIWAWAAIRLFFTA